jgi:hypothetical protein
VLACSLHSKYFGIAAVSAKWIFAHGLGVFAIDSMAVFALLASSINDAWARKNSSSLETRLRYVLSDAFETLPLCEFNDQVLEKVGAQYETHRRALCASRAIGLTDLYNAFHDPANKDPGVQELRELHRKLDLTVARNYGWDDIDFQHGFREVPHLSENDRVRFAIAEPARAEVLFRLSELNKQRYEEEVAAGLHGPGDRPKRPRRTGTLTSSQPALNLGASAGTLHADRPRKTVAASVKKNRTRKTRR